MNDVNHGVSMKTGTAHARLSEDMREILSHPQLRGIWQNLTPLMRNEWICWVESAIKEDARQRRLNRLKSDLISGKRRPCCWMGCIHRTDKNISPSVRGILKKRASGDKV